MPSFHYLDLFILHKPLRVLITGTVKSGVVTPGMHINLDGFRFKIISIEGSFGRIFTEATDGQDVVLSISRSETNDKPTHKYFWNRWFIREKLDPAYEVFSRHCNQTLDIE